MKADNKYVSYLDGFRGYAILLVISSHLHLTKMSVAFLGVTLFFFVSGLLITKLLIFEFNKINTIHLKDFYLRRLFRLYPALIFMVLISCIVLLIHHYKIIWPDILAAFFYFTNYYLVYFDPVVPDVNYLLVSRILWSLSVEEHFYMFFPLLFVLLFSKKHRGFLYFLSVLLAVFLAIRLFVYYTGTDGREIYEITYYTTHCRADSILYGCVAALLIYQYNSKWYLDILRNRASFFIGLALLLFSLVYKDLFFQTTVKYSIQGLAFFIMIPSLSFVFTKGIIRKLIDNPVTVFVGKLSYSLYLFHWVALKIGNLNFTEKSAGWYVFVILATIIFSLTSYYLVEKPFMALRKKYGSNIQMQGKEVIVPKKEYSIN